uniref:Exostosin GT47 domain-containing protein n=1 Tax=Panagrolaimus davidi TaxID=227884 RepID=A0A914PI64_9BILA
MEYNFDYDKLIADLNLNNKTTFPFFGFPFISSIFLQRHIFRSISDFVFAHKYNDLKVESVKCGDIIFVKTDFIKDFIENYHPKIKNPYILLTHESDYGVGHEQWHLKYLNDSKVIKWYAQNVQVSHPKLIPLPLGVVPPAGNVHETLCDLAKTPTPYFNKTQLLYLNFSPNTNKDRIKTLEYFKKTFGNNSLVKINQKRSTWKEYLENIKNSQFVLSPPGNGIDCIRTWEAIIFGSIPIVKRSYLMPLYDRLPVMVVRDWHEVTEESMKKFQQDNLNPNTFSKDGLPWRPSICSLKGAIVGAIANKALGGSAKKGALVGAAAGGIYKYMKRRNRQQLVYGR